MFIVKNAKASDKAAYVEICMQIWGGTDAAKIGRYFYKGLSIFQQGYCVCLAKNKTIGTGEGFPILHKLPLAAMNAVDDPIDLFNLTGNYYYIYGIEVRPEYRHVGAGKALLNYHLNVATWLNCKHICGIAIADNIGFWKRQGFKEEGDWHAYRNFGRFRWINMEIS